MYDRGHTDNGQFRPLHKIDRRENKNVCVGLLGFFQFPLILLRTFSDIEAILPALLSVQVILGFLA